MSGRAISVLRERKAVHPSATRLLPTAKGSQRDSSAKISHTHPIESMSVYVFPVRSLRPCRQLVHPPRAHARVHTYAHTYARLRRF